MRWEKRGLLIPGEPPVSWPATHAMVPVVEQRSGGIVRVYFTTRDEEGRSEVAAADLAFPDGEPRYVGKPLLSFGDLGMFDDSGAMTGSLVISEGRHYLYYIGWSRRVTVPFATFIGCAISEDDGATFERVSPAPVVDRQASDPLLTTSPWVLRDGDRWRMWYVSGTAWRREGQGAKHWYHIRHAESDDGIDWRRDGRVCIDFADASEYAISRPCVVRDGDLYRMWYSRRGDTYRIGYAESNDGLSWTRLDDEVGIDVSESGWDSEMIEYPFVFDHGGRRYLLYNGNGYGRTGVGYAMLAE